MLNSVISRSLISQPGKNQIPLEMCFMILNFIIYSSLKKLVWDSFAEVSFKSRGGACGGGKVKGCRQSRLQMNKCSELEDSTFCKSSPITRQRILVRPFENNAFSLHFYSSICSTLNTEKKFSCNVRKYCSENR